MMYTQQFLRLSMQKHTTYHKQMLMNKITQFQKHVCAPAFARQVISIAMCFCFQNFLAFMQNLSSTSNSCHKYGSESKHTNHSTSMYMLPWSSERRSGGTPLRRWRPSQFWDTMCFTWWMQKRKRKKHCVLCLTIQLFLHKGTEVFISHSTNIGGFQWIFINLLKSAAFSLQISENNQS